MSVWYYASAIFCGLMILTSGYGLIFPAKLRQLGERMLNETGLLIGGAIRIAFGACLVMAAPETNWPEVLKPFGILLIIVGACIPMIGVTRIESLFQRLMEDDSSVKTCALMGLGLAIFILSLILEKA